MTKQTATSLNDAQPVICLRNQDLTPECVAALESCLPPGTSKVWREIAHSVFVTLHSNPDWRSMSEAELAFHAVAGLVEDLGGTQPYIPMGRQSAALDRKARVLELLANGVGYRKAADAVGLKESRVPKINAQSRIVAASAQQQRH